MESFIKVLPVLIATIGYVVWLIRMESKVSEHTADIAELKQDQREEIKEINSKIDSMSEKITDLCILFAEVAGYMKRCNEEKK